MNESHPKNRVIIASDVGDQDGIGIEVYRNDVLILEIFRNDTKQSRRVTLYKKNIDLGLIEQSIETFKKEIPWKFQE